MRHALFWVRSIEIHWSLVIVLDQTAGACILQNWSHERYVDLNKVSGWQKMIFEFPEHVELAVSPFDYVVYVFIPFKI